MTKNNVIELSTYRAKESFDYAAWNRRAEARYRSSEIRAWITHIVDTVVTLAIGACTVFCVILVITMM